MKYTTRPISKYKPSTLEHRAVQFMPFAALKGYEESIHDASLYKEEKRQLSQEQQAELNEKICGLQKMDTVKMECFQDGRYIHVQGNIKKVDCFNLLIYFMDGRKIDIHQIYSIQVV